MHFLTPLNLFVSRLVQKDTFSFSLAKLFSQQFAKYPLHSAPRFNNVANYRGLAHLLLLQLADMPILKRKEVSQMKIATLFLTAVVLLGSFAATSMPARAEDESDVTSSWQDHIRDMRYRANDLE